MFRCKCGSYDITRYHDNTGLTVLKQLVQEDDEGKYLETELVDQDIRETQECTEAVCHECGSVWYEGQDNEGWTIVDDRLPKEIE